MTAQVPDLFSPKSVLRFCQFVGFTLGTGIFLQGHQVHQQGRVLGKPTWKRRKQRFRLHPLARTQKAKGRSRWY